MHAYICTVKQLILPQFHYKSTKDFKLFAHYYYGDA